MGRRTIDHARSSSHAPLARRNGIAGFTAEVLQQNQALQAVFHESGLKVGSRLSGGVLSYRLDFE